MAICANLCFILNTNSRKFPQIIKNEFMLIIKTTQTTKATFKATFVASGLPEKELFMLFVLSLN